jgi:uncharacterized protein (UPF0218 family)
MKNTLEIKLPFFEFEYTRETTLINNIKGFMVVDGEEYILHSINYENDEYVIIYHIYNNGNVKQLTFKTNTLIEGVVNNL